MSLLREYHVGVRDGVVGPVLFLVLYRRTW